MSLCFPLSSIDIARTTWNVVYFDCQVWLTGLDCFCSTLNTQNKNMFDVMLFDRKSCQVEWNAELFFLSLIFLEHRLYSSHIPIGKQTRRDKKNSQIDEKYLWHCYKLTGNCKWSGNKASNRLMECSTKRSLITYIPADNSTD